jgi:hypothetical protein
MFLCHGLLTARTTRPTLAVKFMLLLTPLTLAMTWNVASSGNTHPDQKTVVSVYA